MHDSPHSGAPIPASVGILTFNSAATIGRALESVKDFANIVVCDGGSSDVTLDIARTYGAKIILQDPQFKNSDGRLRNFAGVRNQLLDAAEYDWFLYIDSDETISDGLREEIRSVASAPQHDDAPRAYRVPIGIIMDGRYVKYSSNYPGYQFRFFNKRSGARFVKPVHERIDLPHAVRIGTCVHPWYVHSTKEEWNHYLQNNARYRSLEIAAACQEPWSSFAGGVLWQMRAFCSVLVKSVWIYARHGFEDTLPVKAEWGRAMTPLYLTWGVILCKLSKRRV